MSESHYTKREESELWESFGDRIARQEGPGWTEEFVTAIIDRQNEMGLIGPQRPIPERYKRGTVAAPINQGESHGDEIN